MLNSLSDKEIEQFIHRGFVRIDNAFTKEIADAALDVLWADLPVDRNNPSTWIEPVIRLGMYSQSPFIESLSHPKLHLIFDQLVGQGNWVPCRSVGVFPVRFPSTIEALDTGKHVDAGFPGADPNNYFEWRVNIRSKGRALLMLVLYSDVSDLDAPTILYEGSHLDVAKILSSEGETGLSFMELASRLDETPTRKEVFASGKAGTVYLCHPFLVHAAQAHKGLVPKFMAQPPLFLKNELSISENGRDDTLVARAIRLGITMD